ncbi:MAG: four helix bundle protein [Deltaproteobacteria bacterium]|nr:four helix bundle protein [Deltaproteobacteria bacterium]
MKVSSFRDLRVWQAGMDLVEKVYRVTEKFPKHEEFGLRAQIRRAAVSIPSNIAEGHTREHSKEFLHYLSIAQGSLAELGTQIELAGRLSYIAPREVRDILDYTASLAKQMYALRNSLTNRVSRSNP